MTSTDTTGGVLPNINWSNRWSAANAKPADKLAHSEKWIFGVWGLSIPHSINVGNCCRALCTNQNKDSDVNTSRKYTDTCVHNYGSQTSLFLVEARYNLVPGDYWIYKSSTSGQLWTPWFLLVCRILLDCEYFISCFIRCEQKMAHLLIPLQTKNMWSK